jgi:hypothetical protein
VIILTYFGTILQFICGASVVHRQWALSAGKFYKIKLIFFNILTKLGMHLFSQILFTAHCLEFDVPASEVSLKIFTFKESKLNFMA